MHVPAEQVFAVVARPAPFADVVRESTTRRLQAMTSAKIVSAVVTVSTPGVWHDTMPRACGTANAQLSTPTEMLEMTSSFGAWAGSTSSMAKLDPISPCAPDSAARNATACSGTRGFATVTSCAACWRADWSADNSRKTKTCLRWVV